MKPEPRVAVASARAGGRAFTLVELLIVVGIIGLLITLLMPTLSLARKLTRRAICAHNLEQLSQAFLVRASRSELAPLPGHSLYPPGESWPMVPYDAVPEQGIYLCPEDPGRRWAGEEVPGLQWRVNAGVPFTVPFAPCVNCKTRKGRDARGEYTEYVFEEWPDQEARFSSDGSDYPNCGGRTDKDGVFRVYDNGDGSVTIVLVNLMVDRNPPDDLLVGGKVRWACTRDRINRPDRIFLPNGGFTSYGINSLVSRSEVDPNTVVLVDYNECCVDLTVPHAAAAMLVRSARHLGRLNVLFADQSVRNMGPTELDPRLNMDIWTP